MENVYHFEEVHNSGHHLACILNNGNTEDCMQRQTVKENHQDRNLQFASHQHCRNHHHHHSTNENGNGIVPRRQNEQVQGNGDVEIDANLPAWALADPVDGYIEHPIAGLIMHPSFYDNRHLINLETKPRHIYDGEVDGPLCEPGQKCTHIKNCFEVRVRMAVLAYRMHKISFRDAEYVWRVSRSTIQRRKAALDKRSSVIFLVTPEHPVSRNGT